MGGGGGGGEGEGEGEGVRRALGISQITILGGGTQT